MNDLTLTEQNHVRTALRYLRRHIGGWTAVAAALNFTANTVYNVVRGTNAVSATMAFRVARLVGVTVDDLLAGRCLPDACPRCGYVPDFAEDEGTAVEDGPRPTMGGGLKLVK